MVILGVLINETCYKTGRASTRDFTVTELYIEPLGKQIYILLTIQLYNCEQHG